MGFSSQDTCRRRVLVAAVALLALAASAPSVARAADIETRDLNVLVDGKSAGEVHMTIHRQDDESTVLKCDTDIQVRYLVIRYIYSYRGCEVWKAGRLLRLDSTCNDNGKRYVVSAVAEGEGLRVRVNNQEWMARPDVWLTSYWCLPDRKQRDQPIPVVDADTGRNLGAARLQYVATEQRPLNGQVQNVYHYRLTGSQVQVDLWYDGGERLVRQEWVEDGHRTLLELTRVRR
jgi:hypothetical protein